MAGACGEEGQRVQGPPVAPSWLAPGASGGATSAAHFFSGHSQHRKSVFLLPQEYWVVYVVGLMFIFGCARPPSWLKGSASTLQHMEP